MTTTADKIESLVRAIAELRRETDRLDGELQAIAFTAEAEPADPEALECWANLHADLSGDTYKHKSMANEFKRTTHVYHEVHLREVTPQMRQDEKDAVRFRKLVEMAGVAWQPGDTEWSKVVPGNLLREEIDKVIEEND